MAEAFLCVRCGAPLPASNADSLACPYCGTTNVLRSRVGTADVRQAVRDVLYEDRNRDGVPDAFQRPAPHAPYAQQVYVHPFASPQRPVPRPTGPSAAVIVGIVGAVVASLFVTVSALLVASPSKKRASTPVQTPRAVPSTGNASARPIEPWGEVSAISLDERGDVLAVIGQKVVKADGRSLKTTWTVAHPNGSGRHLFAAKGEWISLATDNDVSFFESASGRSTGTFRFKNGGILEGACAVGTSDVIVDVLGDGTMRFDAATAKKSSGKDSCKLKETFQCGPGQTCGWEHWKSGDLECRYVLRVGKDVYRTCEADDGTKQKLVVRFDAQGKTKWKTPVDVYEFMGIVDGVLVVSTDGARSIAAFDPLTGRPTWSIPLKQSSPLVADRTRVYYGIGGTLAAAGADGKEVARMAMPDSSAR